MFPLVVCALQESGSLPDWEQLVEDRIGEDYERLASETMRAIHIVLYARFALCRHISHIRTASIATGVGNVLGNKGAVAISLQLSHTKLLFIGAHFAAHDEMVDRRNADFQRIRFGLFSKDTTLVDSRLGARSEPAREWPFERVQSRLCCLP